MKKLGLNAVAMVLALLFVFFR
ncbi:hypothetical protein ACFTAO_28225 [Paenibacillus rhizoplanae]